MRPRLEPSPADQAREGDSVKTLVMGTVQPLMVVDGETVIRVAEHYYFSRLTDSDTLQRLELMETRRRG